MVLKCSVVVLCFSYNTFAIDNFKMDGFTISVLNSTISWMLKGVLICTGF